MNFQTQNAQSQQNIYTDASKKLETFDTRRFRVTEKEEELIKKYSNSNAEPKE